MKKHLSDDEIEIIPDKPNIEPQTPITKLSLEIDINKYLDKSIFNIDLDSYKYLVTDVKYAVARKKDYDNK